MEEEKISLSALVPKAHVPRSLNISTNIAILMILLVYPGLLLPIRIPQV